jgi:hypothetical protein
MRIWLGKTSGALCAAALVLAPALVTPAAARGGGGGPTNEGGFTNPSQYGAHFSGDENSPGGFAGQYGAQRHGGQGGYGYSGYGGYNCNPAGAIQNPQMCK